MCGGALFGGGKQSAPPPPPPPPVAAPPPVPTASEPSGTQRKDQVDRLRYGLASTIKTTPKGPLADTVQTGKQKLGV